MSIRIRRANTIPCTPHIPAGLRARHQQLSDHLGVVLKKVVAKQTVAAAVQVAVPAVWVGHAHALVDGVAVGGHGQSLALQHGLVDGAAAAVVEFGRAVGDGFGGGPAVGVGAGGGGCQEGGEGCEGGAHFEGGDGGDGGDVEWDCSSR